MREYTNEERLKYAEEQNLKNAIWELYNEKKISSRIYKDLPQTEKDLVDAKKLKLRQEYRLRKLNLQNNGKIEQQPKNQTKTEEPILFGSNVKNPRKIYQANYKKDWYGTAFFINDRLDETKERDIKNIKQWSKEKRKNYQEIKQKPKIFLKNAKKEKKKIERNIRIINKNLQKRIKPIYHKPKEVKRQSFFNLPKLIGFK